MHRSRSPAESVMHRTSNGRLARICGWHRRSLATIVVPLRPVPPLKIAVGSLIATPSQVRALDGGEDPGSVVSDRHGVLPMRSDRTIAGHHGPLIVEHLHSGAAESCHGLN